MVSLVDSTTQANTQATTHSIKQSGARLWDGYVWSRDRPRKGAAQRLDDTTPITPVVV